MTSWLTSQRATSVDGDIKMLASRYGKGFNILNYYLEK